MGVRRCRASLAAYQPPATACVEVWAERWRGRVAIRAWRVFRGSPAHTLHRVSRLTQAYDAAIYATATASNADATVHARSVPTAHARTSSGLASLSDGPAAACPVERPPHAKRQPQLLHMQCGQTQLHLWQIQRGQMGGPTASSFSSSVGITACAASTRTKNRPASRSHPSTGASAAPGRKGAKAGK